MKRSYAISLTTEHDVSVNDNTTAVIVTRLEVILDATDAIDACYLTLKLIAQQYVLDPAVFATREISVDCRHE